MMMLFPLLGLLLIGGVLVALLIGGGLLYSQGSCVKSSDPRSRPAGRQTLDTRLARGEISLEEYESRRRQIES